MNSTIRDYDSNIEKYSNTPIEVEVGKPCEVIWNPIPTEAVGLCMRGLYSQWWCRTHKIGWDAPNPREYTPLLKRGNEPPYCPVARAVAKDRKNRTL